MFSFNFLNKLLLEYRFRRDPAICLFKQQINELKSIIKDVDFNQAQNIIAQQHGYYNWKQLTHVFKESYLEKTYYPINDYFLGKNLNSSSKIYTNLKKNLLLLGEKSSLYQKNLIKSSISKGNKVIHVGNSYENIEEIIEHAIACGREKDIVWLNFSETSTNDKYKKQFFLGNFFKGTAKEIEQFLNYIFLFNSDDNQWLGRASHLIHIITPILVYLRDHEKIGITQKTYQEVITLDFLVNFYHSKKHLNLDFIKLLENYLSNLPGVSLNKNIIPAYAQEIHQYIAILISLVNIANQKNICFFKEDGLRLAEDILNRGKLILLATFDTNTSHHWFINYLLNYITNTRLHIDLLSFYNTTLPENMITYWSPSCALMLSFDNSFINPCLYENLGNILRNGDVIIQTNTKNKDFKHLLYQLLKKDYITPNPSVKLIQNDKLTQCQKEFAWYFTSTRQIPIIPTSD